MIRLVLFTTAAQLPLDLGSQHSTRALARRRERERLPQIL
jgi:hypothetical protein